MEIWKTEICTKFVKSLDFACQDADLDEQLTYKALLKLRYGQKKSCLEADGIIVSKIVHSTTPESVAELKDKDHYKNCMQDKTKPEWVNRKSLPLSPSCWLTKYDASNARKYTWDVKFQGVTPSFHKDITSSKVSHLVKTLNTQQISL